MNPHRARTWSAPASGKAQPVCQVGWLGCEIAILGGAAKGLDVPWLPFDAIQRFLITRMMADAPQVSILCHQPQLLGVLLTNDRDRHSGVRSVVACLHAPGPKTSET